MDDIRKQQELYRQMIAEEAQKAEAHVAQKQKQAYAAQEAFDRAVANEACVQSNMVGSGSTRQASMGQGTEHAPYQTEFEQLEAMMVAMNPFVRRYRELVSKRLAQFQDKSQF